jgi:hypothetical protein
MDSGIRNECSHSLGFPIRKSPDHSLLAASRGLSQLTTSFFAYLRLGIHTHALSSLTIISTSYTVDAFLSLRFLLVFLMPVNIQLSKISITLSNRQNLPALRTADLQERTQFAVDSKRPLGSELVGPGGIEPPTSPLSGVRSSHLSYGPMAD